MVIGMENSLLGNYFLHQRLQWFTDETLFSLCSRVHSFRGAWKFSDTSSNLFGARYGGALHDFPNCLDAFVARSSSCWGDAESIISDHTIAPFFAPFQTQENAQLLLKAMRSDHLGGIKYRLGLLTSRFGGYHPLKACPDCMSADVLAVGVAYWHLSHQYPGVHICPTHGRLLSEHMYKRAWAGRFSWVLPRLELLSPPSEAAITSIDIEVLLALTRASIRLSNVGFHQNLAPYLVTSAYREAIGQNGKCTPTLDAVENFREFAAPLKSLPIFQSLPDNNQSARSFLLQMLRTPRGPLHPLKHLALIVWRFGDLDKFLSAYDQVQRTESASTSDFDLGPDSPTEPVVPDRPAACSAQLNQRVLRPKVLKTGIRSELIELLQWGTPKADLCRRFRITVSTINKLLRADPILQSAWVLAHHQQLLSQHRSRWLRACECSKGLSTNNFRQRSPSTYAWLYRNDKAWLLAQTATLPSGRIGNNSCIDWAVRDSELEKLVREKLRETFGQEGGLELTRYQLYTLVPSLPTALQHSGRYAKTRALLSAVLSHRRLN